MCEQEDRMAAQRSDLQTDKGDGNIRMITGMRCIVQLWEPM